MRNAFLAALAIAVAAGAAPRKVGETLESQLGALKAQLAVARDSLQTEIASRWRAKQRSVEQREADKEELETLRDRVERAYAELARIKEECLVQERMIADIGKEVDARREEWSYAGGVLGDVLAKEAEGLMQTFPLDREQRRLDLEAARRQLRKSADAAAALAEFVRYRIACMQRTRAVTLGRETIMPEQGGAVAVSLARFGSVFAYGISESGEVYAVRQSGRLGAERYRIDRIAALHLAGRIAQLFAAWTASGAVSGRVPVDVMQNEMSGILIAGKKATWWQKTMRSLRAGGAVMVPLLLVMAWAFVLTVIKAVQFIPRRRRDALTMRMALESLSATCSAEAAARFAACKGPAARVLQACLAGASAGGPHASEQAAREAIAREGARLNAHLNTMAVIAGAAPLLGLLGTISGMINLFAAVTHYGAGDPKFLAGGISEALITSKTGLAIAIPLLFIHNYLRNAKDRILAEIEQHALRLLKLVEERNSNVAAPRDAKV